MNSNNIYPSFETKKEKNGYVKIKFVILEKDWPYPNFEINMPLSDPLMFIHKELQDRHGRIKDISLYIDGEKNNQSNTNLQLIQYVFDKSIGDALGIQGSLQSEESYTITIYYDFKNAINSPIQLY